MYLYLFVDVYGCSSMNTCFTVNVVLLFKECTNAIVGKDIPSNTDNDKCKETKKRKYLCVYMYMCVCTV